MGWGGEAACGQNSTKGSAQFSDEQGLQQPSVGKPSGPGRPSLSVPASRPTSQPYLQPLMGKLRPTRAAGQTRGQEWSERFGSGPWEGFIRWALVWCLFPFPCNLGLQIRTTQGPLMEARNAQEASVGAWAALVPGQRWGMVTAKVKAGGGRGGGMVTPGPTTSQTAESWSARLGAGWGRWEGCFHLA